MAYINGQLYTFFEQVEMNKGCETLSIFICFLFDFIFNVIYMLIANSLFQYFRV